MNSRRKLNSLVTLAAIACLLVGCRKVKNTPINQEMLKCLTYNTGSYWVYQDSATGRVDSLVFAAGRITYGYNSGDDFDTHDKYSGRFDWYNATDRTLFSKSEWVLQDDYVEWEGGGLRYTPLIIWPVSDGSAYSYGRHEVSVLGTALLKVPGQADVTCFRIHHAIPYYDSLGVLQLRDQDFYYNKQIGIVRMVVTVDGLTYTFNLIKYK